MAREIRIYNTAFNRDELAHIMHSSLSSYLTFLENYRMRTYTSESYRITENRLLLSVLPTTGATISNTQARRVVYAAEVETENGAITSASFYFVSNGLEKSGFYEFSLSRDLWAEHIRNAVFSQFHITRCNREIGNGIYDEVKATTGALFNFYGSSLNVPISDYAAVFSAAIVVKANGFGGDPITQTFLFYIPLEDIAAAAISDFAALDIMEKVRFVIGGIKECGSSWAGWPSTNNMQVLNCWILPKTVAKSGDIGLFVVKSESIVTGGEHAFTNVMIVKNGTYLIQQSIISLLGGNAPYRYPNSHIEFGTRGHTMKLLRYTNNDVVYVRFFVTSSDVRAQVEQGNKMEDISAAFALDLNINNQVGTGVQQMANETAKVVTLLAAAAKGYANGGVGAAALTLGTGALSMIGQQGANAPSCNNGDAFTTFGLNDANYLQQPFVVASTLSNEDEDEHAYYIGATYDIYRSDFAIIQACNHLGKVSSDKQRDGTFITSDSFDVEYLPVEVEDYVRAEFGRGIWLYVI